MLAAVSIADVLAQDCGSIPELIHLHALARPSHPALIVGDDRMDYAGLDATMDRVAAALQRDGAAPAAPPQLLRRARSPTWPRISEPCAPAHR